MARYATIGSMALVAAKTVHTVIGSATARPRIYDIVLSSSSAPNDYDAHFYLQRGSADGTGTAFTPIALDSNERAPIATSKYNYSAEPTLTANSLLLNVAHNLRATVRWVAAPGSEFIVPATAGALLALVCQAVSTQFTEQSTMLFEE